jgi:hypothetical protein
LGPLDVRCIQWQSSSSKLATNRGQVAKFARRAQKKTFSKFHQQARASSWSHIAKTLTPIQI